MVFEPSVFRVALATTGMVGAPFEDVSDKVLFDEGGFEYGWGRESQFRDTRPGEFSFTLDNSDGRFSPESSFYPVPLFEGMRVLWMLGGELVDEMLTPTDEITGLLSGGRVVEGRIASLRPLFADITNAETARMRVTVVDELAALSKISVASPLSRTVLLGCGASLLIPFGDAAGSVAASDVLGGLDLVRSDDVATLTFGVDPRESGETDQCRITVGAGQSDSLGPRNGLLFPGPYGTGSVVSVWLTPNNTTSTAQVNAGLKVSPNSELPLRVRIQDDEFQVFDSSTASWEPVLTFTVGRAYHVTAEASGTLATIRIDGATVYTFNDFATTGPRGLSLSVGGAGATDFTISDMASLTTVPQLESLGFATAAQRLAVLEQAGGGDVFDSLPAGLSDSILDPQTGGGTLLDAVSDVIRAEQGHIYAVTTGNLTAPSSTVVVRERDRPATVTETFTTTTDLSGAPKLDRNIVDAASEVIVTSSGGQFVVRDASLLERLGTVSRSRRCSCRSRSRRFPGHATGSCAVNRSASTWFRSRLMLAVPTPTGGKTYSGWCRVTGSLLRDSRRRNSGSRRRMRG